MMIFLLFGQFTRHPFIELFHLSNLLQMLNDCRMVNIEFLDNFSCSCKRISFDDGSQLVFVNLWWLPLHSSSSSFSSPLQNFLNHHCTVRSLAVPGPDMLLMLWVVSTALRPILKSGKLLEFAFCLTSFLNSKYKQLMSFSSVQSLSHVRLFATPWIAAHQASLSNTNSRSSLRDRKSVV